MQPVLFVSRGTKELASVTKTDVWKKAQLTSVDLAIPSTDLGCGDTVAAGNGIALVPGMNLVPAVAVGCVARHDWGNCGGRARRGCACRWRWSYAWNANADVVVEPQIVALCVDLCVPAAKLGDRNTIPAGKCVTLVTGTNLVPAVAVGCVTGHDRGDGRGRGGACCAYAGRAWGHAGNAEADIVVEPEI